jgi:hypothetical protein
MNDELGMSHGKAVQILRKSLLFSLVKKLHLDVCYRCNKKIKNIKEFSIEHKRNWLHSSNPIKLFFNLKNISFSHLKCNCCSPEHMKKFIELGRMANLKKKIICPVGQSWCSSCKLFKPIKEFYRNKNNFNRNGFTSQCKIHYKNRDRKNLKNKD